VLVSNPHRFIFIHIYKNAGTSISRALYPFSATRMHWRLHNYAQRLGIHCFAPGRLPRGCQGHTKAKEAVAVLGEKAWDAYFTFAFARNPWDWILSQYFYMLKDETHHQHKIAESFEDYADYVRWRCEEDCTPQKEWVCDDDGHILIDFVGRYEYLEDDFQEICRRIGVEAELPSYNKSEHAPYYEYYSDRTEDMVRRAYRQDIEFFGYEFRSSPAAPLVRSR